jgi:hypothetical protein
VAPVHPKNAALTEVAAIFHHQPLALTKPRGPIR